MSVEWRHYGPDIAQAAIPGATLEARVDGHGVAQWYVGARGGWVRRGSADSLDDAKRQAVDAARERIAEAVTALGGTVTWEEEG